MKKLLLITILSFSIATNVAFAADTYTLLEPLPCIEGVGKCEVGKLQNEINFTDYVGYVFKFSIAIAVLLAVIMVIYGGFEYMLSEAIPAKLDAKGRIKKALTGLLLVFSSYLILRIVDPRLVQVYSEIPPVNFKSDQDTSKFEQKLTEDLKNINAESLKVVNKANEERTAAKEKLATIENNYKNGQIDEEEYQIQKATEAEIIRKKNIEISREITGTMGRNTIKNLSIDLRVNPQTNWYGASDPDWSLIDKKIEETNKFYYKYIDEMKASNNAEGASILQTDRVFYVDQLREEGEMIKEVDKSYQDQTTKSLDAVRNRLKSYQEEYATFSTDPRLEVQYKNLLEIRIAYIRSYLEKAAAPKK